MEMTYQPNERLSSLLRDAIVELCHKHLPYADELKIDGTIYAVSDQTSVFTMQISEKIGNSKELSVAERDNNQKRVGTGENNSDAYDETCVSSFVRSEREGEADMADQLESYAHHSEMIREENHQCCKDVVPNVRVQRLVNTETDTEEHLSPFSPQSSVAQVKCFPLQEQMVIKQSLDGRFHCPYCFDSFEFDVVLMEHLKKHSGESLHMCKHCGDSFTRLASLSAHAKRNHSVSMPECFQCAICLENVQSYHLLKQHYSSFHTDIKYPEYALDLDVENVDDASKVTLRGQGDNSITGIDFEKTDMSFAEMMGRDFDEVNIKTEQGYYRFKCKVCNKLIKFRNSLHEHLNSHLGKKPHKCSSCGDSFAHHSSLYNHVRCKHRSQTDAEVQASLKFVCLWCDRKFRYKSELERHLKGHPDHAAGSFLVQ